MTSKDMFYAMTAGNFLAFDGDSVLQKKKGLIVWAEIIAWRTPAVIKIVYCNVVTSPKPWS